MPEAARIACIGGADMDRKARLQAPAVLGSSNPVTTEATPGGVARNVAATLGRLRFPISLFSVVGDDPAGTTVLRQTAAAGVKVTGVARLGLAKTAGYTAILQPGGDLVIGIAEMAIFDQLTPAWIHAHLPDLAGHDYWFVDANLPADVLQALLRAGERTGKTVLADPVSAAKAPRLRPVLDRIDVLFPDPLETAALIGRPVQSTAEALSAAAALRAAGVGTVVVTLGAQGIAIDDGGQRAVVPPPPVDSVRDVTGAGDAFIAGFLYGMLRHGPGAGVDYGLAAAALVIADTRSAADSLTVDTLEQRAGQG